MSVKTELHCSTDVRSIEMKVTVPDVYLCAVRIEMAAALTRKKKINMQQISG